jgi:NAD-dependent deacetylase
LSHNYGPANFDDIFDVGIDKVEFKVAKESKSTAKRKLNIVVLTGAGISAESGIGTFRGAGGLWEGHDVNDVATPEAWEKDYKRVLEFYNLRRQRIAEVKPNRAHYALAALENQHQVQIVTQNIDNLHEAAGSNNILHLHGEITKACSSLDKSAVTDIGFKNIEPGMVAEDGSQLRPYIVWFGEAVPKIPEAAILVQQADILVIIGTSLNVYPAAGLVHYAKQDVPVFLIDPGDFSGMLDIPNHVTHIKEVATIGVDTFSSKYLPLL